jgi:hypothetical protein
MMGQYRTAFTVQPRTRKPVLDGQDVTARTERKEDRGYTTSRTRQPGRTKIQTYGMLK